MHFMYMSFESQIVANCLYLQGNAHYSEILAGLFNNYVGFVNLNLFSLEEY